MGKNTDRIGEKNINYQGCPMEIIEYHGAQNLTIQFSCGTIVAKKEYAAFSKGSIKNPKFHIGEIHTNNQGYPFKIIDIFGSSNCTIQYEDGVIKEKVPYFDILRGATWKPFNEIGTKYMTNEGYEVEIIEYFNSRNLTIRFSEQNMLRNVTLHSLRKGAVKNPLHRSVNGVGYLGKYAHSKVNSLIYDKWGGMMDRCYSKNQEIESPSYLGVSVCKEWHNFENFVDWFEKIYNPVTMLGFHLDKDILVKGNKVYSPETCELVPPEINFCFVRADKRRGNLPIGVSKSQNKFEAGISCGNSRIRKKFDTSTEAFLFYKEHKEAYIKELADKWKGCITERCYQAMYNYQVEITD